MSRQCSYAAKGELDIIIEYLNAQAAEDRKVPLPPNTKEPAKKK